MPGFTLGSSGCEDPSDLLEVGCRLGLVGRDVMARTASNLVPIRPGHETPRQQSRDWLETLYMALAHLLPLLYRLTLPGKGKSLETTRVSRRPETVRPKSRDASGPAW